MSECQRGQQLPGVRTPAGGEGESPRIPSATAHTTATDRENCRLLGGQKAVPAPGIRNLHGDLDGPSSGWDISLWLGIRIRPCEGELRSDIYITTTSKKSYGDEVETRPGISAFRPWMGRAGLWGHREWSCCILTGSGTSSPRELTQGPMLWEGQGSIRAIKIT